MDNNSFFSIDKLVEFGLGLGIAQQMVTMMNQSMKGMYVPGSYMSLPSLQENIYVAIDGNATGPLTASEFKNLISTGKINKDSLAWLPGMMTWKSLEQVPDLLKIIALTPPPINKHL